LKRRSRLEGPKLVSIQQVSMALPQEHAKLKPVSYRELARVFEADGFRCTRQEGDHMVFTKAAFYGQSSFQICGGFLSSSSRTIFELPVCLANDTLNCSPLTRGPVSLRVVINLSSSHRIPDDVYYQNGIAPPHISSWNGRGTHLPLLDSMVPALSAATKPTPRLGFVYVPNGIIQEQCFPAKPGPAATGSSAHSEAALRFP